MSNVNCGRLTAEITQEDKWFVAYCPELGTVSQGKTQSEALINLKSATILYLEEKNPVFQVA